MGDVMIYRTSLVAGPVGSDWRTRRLNHRTLDGGSQMGSASEGRGSWLDGVARVDT